MQVYKLKNMGTTFNSGKGGKGGGKKRGGGGGGGESPTRNTPKSNSLEQLGTTLQSKSKTQLSAQLARLKNNPDPQYYARTERLTKPQLIDRIVQETRINQNVRRQVR